LPIAVFRWFSRVFAWDVGGLSIRYLAGFDLKMLDECIANNLLTTWDMRTHGVYNANAVWEKHYPLEITGNPRDTNLFAT
jgi:hypothetical protein